MKFCEMPYTRPDIDETKKSFDSLTAVSYTHLDVYKRQVEVTVPGAEGKLTPASGSLTFTEPGEYTVYFNHTVNLDNDFQYALCSGPIRVSVFLKGDVNSDGRVGMLDIVTLIRYLFGWDVEISEKAADMNSRCV